MYWIVHPLWPQDFPQPSLVFQGLPHRLSKTIHCSFNIQCLSKLFNIFIFNQQERMVWLTGWPVDWSEYYIWYRVINNIVFIDFSLTGFKKQKRWQQPTIFVEVTYGYFDVSVWSDEKKMGRSGLCQNNVTAPYCKDWEARYPPNTSERLRCPRIPLRYPQTPNRHPPDTQQISLGGTRG